MFRTQRQNRNTKLWAFLGSYMGSDKILAGKDNFSILECRSMGKKEIKQEKTLLQTSLAHYVESKEVN